MAALLSSTVTDDSAGLTESQLDYQRSIEKDAETRIQTMLERIVGVNKAVVRVSQAWWISERSRRRRSGTIRTAR